MKFIYFFLLLLSFNNNKLTHTFIKIDVVMMNKQKRKKRKRQKNQITYKNNEKTKRILFIYRIINIEWQQKLILIKQKII
jgi:hypothetical protein